MLAVPGELCWPLGAGLPRHPIRRVPRHVARLFCALLFSLPPRLRAPTCHASCAGVCVPIASEVVGAGAGGNGPVYVVGHDVDKLDRDGDGVACEPK